MSISSPRTLLDLVNRARSECGVAGPALSSLTAVSGESLRFKNWVIEAWNDLQIARDTWNFMVRTFSFQTIANQQTYTPAECGVTDLSHWHLRTFRCYVTAEGHSSDQFLLFNDRLQFRDTFGFGAALSNYQRPTIFTVEDDGQSLSFGAIPDSAAYTIYGEYYASPSELNMDDDEPAYLPWQYRMVLVYDVMKKYAGFESAVEVFDRATMGYDKRMNDLERVFLPALTLGEPLA